MLGLTPNAFTVAGRHLLDAHMHTQLLGLQRGPSVLVTVMELVTVGVFVPFLGAYN